VPAVASLNYSKPPASLGWMFGIAVIVVVVV